MMKKGGKDYGCKRCNILAAIELLFLSGGENGDDSGSY
jgi:hypothetical protein